MGSYQIEIKGCVRLYCNKPFTRINDVLMLAIFEHLDSII